MTNFLPFAEAEFDFSSPGLTLVEGNVSKAGGYADSNGAGKSALLESIPFLLFGRCVRPKYTGDSVVRRGSAGGCAVVGQLKRDSTTLQIERYQKHKQYGNAARVLIDGKVVSSGVAVNQYIERVLGVDYDGFLNTVMLAARDDARSFLSAADSDRKSFLDSLFGFQRFADARDVAAKAMRRLQSSVEAATNRVNMLKNQLDVSKQAYAAAESTLATLKASLSAAKSARDSASKQRNVARLAHKAAQERLASVQDRVGELLESHAASVREWQQATRTAAVQQSTAEVQLRQHEMRIRELKSQLERVGSRRTCPTCRRVMAVESQREQVAERKRLKAEISREGSAADAVAMQIDVCKQRAATPQPIASAELTKAQKALDDAQQVERDAEIRVTRAESVLSSCESDVRTRETELVRIDRLSDQRKSLAALQSELNDASGELQRLSESTEYSAAQFWVDGFGQAGIKSFLAEAYYPALSDRASDYARRLFGPGAVIDISAITTLKSGETRERVSVDVDIPGMADSYYGASRGQRNRLHVAVLLAFMDVMTQMVGVKFDQLFADELFDGVDRVGIERIGALLSERAKTVPVCVITHSPTLRGYADRVVTITHDGKTACIS